MRSVFAVHKCLNGSCWRSTWSLFLVIGVISGWQSTSTCGVTPAESGFRVGNLIANGSFVAPGAWRVQRFHVEKVGLISNKGEGGAGSLATTFLGANGFYQIRVRYLDEGDGVSGVQLSVGGRMVGRWSFDGILVDRFRWKVFDGVQIDQGDEITLLGRSDGSEYCRMAGIEILPSKPLQAENAVLIAKKVEYSMQLIPVNGHSVGKQNPEFLLAPDSIFSGGSGRYWVYLSSEQPFRLTAQAAFGDTVSTLHYRLTKVGATQPTAEETFVSSDSVPIYVTKYVATTGLYELKIAPALQGGMSVKFSVNVPCVTKLELGAREGYFFVPRNTQTFGLKCAGHVVLIDAAGRVMFDELLENDSLRNIAVSAGSDGQVWYFQGNLGELFGVPPYVAAKRDAMLAPAELLQP